MHRYDSYAVHRSDEESSSKAVSQVDPHVASAVRSGLSTIVDVRASY